MQDAVLVEAEWMHECLRTTKRDGIPKFNGCDWVCSRCSMTYGVDHRGCSREQAVSMFWRYLANSAYVRRDIAVEMTVEVIDTKLAEHSKFAHDSKTASDAYHNAFVAAGHEHTPEVRSKQQEWNQLNRIVVEHFKTL